MRGLTPAAALWLACAATTQATPSSFEGVRASGSVSAEATGKILGERFDLPASSSRSSTGDLAETPLADSIGFFPDLSLLSGGAQAGYAASMAGNVLTAAATGNIVVKATESEQANDLLLTTSSSVTFDFTLPHTVAADLAVALSRDHDGFTQVRTTLSGPSTNPTIDLDRDGDSLRTFILPPGAYRLTFTHLTAAGVESEQQEPKAESGGSARFSLTVDPCGADCNGDNRLDIHDFICFQQRIEDRQQKADLNNDGRFDILDMIVFQELFVSGCE